MCNRKGWCGFALGVVRSTLIIDATRLVSLGCARRTCLVGIVATGLLLMLCEPVLKCLRVDADDGQRDASEVDVF